jgi:hypothetical protein
MKTQFQGARWLKIQALLDDRELSSLMQTLEPFAIYPLSGAMPMDAFPMPREQYLGIYRDWIEGLKMGIVPTSFGTLNASMWTRSQDSHWFLPFPDKRVVAKPKEPFLQVQVHHMGYSLADHVFRPMSLNQDAIFWGLQFSFPQIYEHPEMGIVESKGHVNLSLFHTVRKWSREHTIPTPMNRKNLPIRIGKNCLSWVNSHPALLAKGLCVGVDACTN